MDFALSEEHLELQKWAHEFAEKEIRPVAAEYDESEEFPWPVVKKAAETGLYSLDLYMQSAQDPTGLTLPIVAEELFWGCAGIALCLIGTGLPLSALASVGTSEQLFEWAPKMFGTPEDPKVGAFCVTEPQAGSDVRNLRTRAVRDGDHWVLNGRKHFITNGQHADFALVFAANDRERKAQGGITAFLIEKGTPGFDVGRAQIGMVEAEGQFELTFEDCRVHEEQILGGPDNVGMGFYSAMQFLAMGRLSIGAMCNGIAEYALSLGTEYAKNRVAFDRPIGKNQYVQGHLVESLVEIKASKLMTYECAWRYDQGDPVIQESSIVKLYASEMVNRVVDRMIQVHGGMGWMRELPLERIYRLVRIFPLVEGTSEIQKYIIAKTLGL